MMSKIFSLIVGIIISLSANGQVQNKPENSGSEARVEVRIFYLQTNEGNIRLDSTE